VAVAQMVANARPATIFMLDSRIPPCERRCAPVKHCSKSAAARAEAPAVPFADRWRLPHPTLKGARHETQHPLAADRTGRAALLAGRRSCASAGQGYTPRRYTPPLPAESGVMAATPIPTARRPRQQAPSAVAPQRLKRGPVVVDLAHYAHRAQPLSAAGQRAGGAGAGSALLAAEFLVSDRINFGRLPDQSDVLTRNGWPMPARSWSSAPFSSTIPREVAVVARSWPMAAACSSSATRMWKAICRQDTNILAAPSDVVFNEDYLYDTVDNDTNFTYFFQGEFTDRAEDLAGSRIAFYGGRSISGAMTPQARTASTTLSSLRTGQTDLVTVAIGGQAANNSVGRVLAMSDFDVLTEPYVMRYENRELLDFVASFLTGAQRTNTIADFPAFLGKEVALVIDSTQPVGATGAEQGRRIAARVGGVWAHAPTWRHGLADRQRRRWCCRLALYRPLRGRRPHDDTAR
jgi:hypothetical protein